MESFVIKIIEDYLEVKSLGSQRGYSDALRLEYDNDAKYYLSKGYSKNEALHADTIISFWTIYKTVLEKESGWKAYKTEKSLKRLLCQIRSNRKNDYTEKINCVNDKLEDLAKKIYSEGNYMLLPEGKRKMNNERYQKFEDRIDLTLLHLFSGGELSHYFKNDEQVCEWIKREKLDMLFTNKDINKSTIKWLVNNQKLVSEMELPELYDYIDSAVQFIDDRLRQIHREVVHYNPQMNRVI